MMKSRLCIAVLIVLAQAVPTFGSGVHLSFYGHQSTPVGCFDEAADSLLLLDLDATFGPEFQGSSYYFGFLSRNHLSVGCSLSDTQSDPGCLGYDVTAWFEPGDVIIGHVNGSGDQNASLEGNEWLGHVPSDFTHIKIEFQAGHPCEQDRRTFVLPIVWMSHPVTASAGTWGRIKALYR